MKEKIRREATTVLAMSFVSFMAAHTGQRFMADAALFALTMLDAVKRSAASQPDVGANDKLARACDEAAKSFRSTMESQIVLAAGPLPHFKARE